MSPLRRVIVSFSFLLMIFSSSLFAKTEGELAAGMVNPGYHAQPAWFKNSFLDINEDIAEAKENGKRLMLFFYQDGCPYCKKLLEDNFGQQYIAEKTQKNFDVVSINIWGDRDITLGKEELTEKQLAERLKILYTPTLIFFNENGKAVLRANGYYYPEKFNAALDFVLGKNEKKESFRQYLARISPAPSKGVIHDEVATMSKPYDFSKKSAHQYRLVMFEQKKCKACDELHQDVLQRKASKDLLKNFDIAVVDMWSDEKITLADGSVKKISDWAKSLNIQYAPSLVYFDAKGKEVFRAEAYLKSFHIQSGMDYVQSGAYKTQPNLQRYIDARATRLRAEGVKVDLMK